MKKVVITAANRCKRLDDGVECACFPALRLEAGVFSFLGLHFFNAIIKRHACLLWVVILGLRLQPLFCVASWLYIWFIQ